jgi:hypothetical protein
MLANFLGVLPILTPPNCLASILELEYHNLGGNYIKKKFPPMILMQLSTDEPLRTSVLYIPLRHKETNPKRLKPFLNMFLRASYIKRLEI